jgi:tRNA-specific 2-thiouridylase
MQKVLVAMSGGVDSSAAAILLQEQGLAVVGVTLKMFANEEIGLEKESRCCSLSDVEDARLVAHKLGFDHFVFNYCDCFKKYVIDHFVAEYEAGRTPNPCVDCNKHIKFGELYQRARLLECDYLATGHYANVFYDETRQRWVLTRGDDRKKDQSYMLFNLTQEQLAHILLPLGHKTKPEIRALAESRGLLNAKKPDSQDICFVPDGDYAQVIELLIGRKTRPGKFIHVNGQELGTHRGQLHYTIGQRKGLGIAYEYPLYVIKKDVERNIVYLGPLENLFQKTLLAKDCNWISIAALTGPLKVTAKTRYRAVDVPAILEPAADGKVLVTFDEPQKAITPGQAVVFYQDEYVVGGGTIEK